MEKFKCVECDFNEVEADGDTCEDCLAEYDDNEDDFEDEEDEADEERPGAEPVRDIA